jgi:hypothetical protein
MSIIESIQKTALLAAIEPDGEAVLRNLFRWFSKTFHTPLADVEEMPIEYILQHYFESQYEELENEDKHNLIIFLLESKEEREARKKRESQEEDDFIKEAEAEAASGITLQEKTKKLNKPLVQKAIKNLEAIEKAIEEQEIKISFVDEIPDRDSLG